MMRFDQFEREVEAIPYQYRHPRFLYSLIRWLRPKVCVEVGTHIGYAACWLVRGLQENGEGVLHCIDPFCWVTENQEEQWERNTLRCDVRDRIMLWKGRSQEVIWPERIDFAYIDGNHTYDVAKHDVIKAIKLGASCIAMHDTVSWEGSRNLADNFRIAKETGLPIEGSQWDLFEQNFDDGLMVLLKWEPKGPCRGKDIGEVWDKPTVKA